MSDLEVAVGQTLGKRLLGPRVLGAAGARPVGVGGHVTHAAAVRRLAAPADASAR
jgi:hypothetical protein